MNLSDNDRRHRPRLPAPVAKLRGSRTRGRLPRLALALLAPLALLGSVVIPSGPAGAASNGQWSLAPYTAPGTSLPRSFFDYTLSAGQTITDQAALANYTVNTLSFKVYPSDAINVANGGAFGLLLPKDTMHHLGTWVTTGAPLYSVEPHTEIVFKFTLTVPPGTPPGDYAGGLVALNEKGSVSKNGPININIEQAVGSRIFVHVTGATHPGIAINSVTPAVSTPGVLGALIGKGSGAVEVHLTNTGNSILQRVTTTVTATGLFGGSAGTFHPNIVQDLLPGSSVTVRVPWPDVSHLGVYHLHTTVTTSGGKPPQPTATAGATYWDIPWLLVVLVLLLIASPFAYRYWRRRQERARNRPGPDAPEPDSPDGAETSSVGSAQG